MTTKNSAGDFCQCGHTRREHVIRSYISSTSYACSTCDCNGFVAVEENLTFYDYEDFVFHLSSMLATKSSNPCGEILLETLYYGTTQKLIFYDYEEIYENNDTVNEKDDTVNLNGNKYTWKRIIYDPIFIQKYKRNNSKIQEIYEKPIQEKIVFYYEKMK